MKNDKFKKLLPFLLPSAICFFVGGVLGAVIGILGVALIAVIVTGLAVRSALYE